MVRAPRYGYQQGYASWQRQPLWQEGERIDKWNPYYRQDLTGADEEISLEDVEGGKPPTYVPQIDRQALGYKDVLGPRNHPWQAHGGPTDLIAPPTPPQQDTQSVAAVFGGPQSGATAMAEDPRQKAARIAREAFERDPSLIKEFLPKLRDAGVDPSLGAPEGWSLPEAPETWQTPGFGTETEAERAARRAEQEAAYRRDIFPPGTGISGPAVPGGIPPGYTPPQGAGPSNSLAGLSPNYSIGSGLIAGNAGRAPQPRPEEFGPPAPYSGPMPRDPMPRPYNAPGTMERMREPEAGLPRPRPGPIPMDLGGGSPQTQFAMLPNGPREWSLGIQTPRGQQSRLPLARPDMPQDVAARPPLIDPGRFGAGLPGPAAAPNPLAARTGLRIPDDASMPPGLAPPARTGFGNEALNIDPATGMPRSTDPFLTGLPAQGAIDQTVQRASTSPIDPAAIAEARQTLQLHPDTGRIRTAPGFRQSLEPARLPPVPGQAEAPLMRDLEAERNSPEVRARVAAEAAATQTARLPRARPEEFGPPIDAMEAIGSDVPGPQSGLVRDSVSGKLYDPTAMGGPAGEEDLIAGEVPLPKPQRKTTPTDIRVARQALIDNAGRTQAVPESLIAPITPPTNDLIAGPEVGAINNGQLLAPPPSATVPPVPSPAPAPLIAPPASVPPIEDYAGPTAQSRRTGLGPFNIFDREHYVGGPGLTRPISGTVTDYTKSAKPGRGKYKPSEHERLAGRIGKTAGLAASVVGVPPIVAVPLGGMAGRMTARGLDPNRQVFERGPLGFFRGIFGGPRSKDKKKNQDPAGIKEAAAAREAAAKEASRSGSGLGSDRSYGGYGYGGGYYGGGSFPGYGGYGGGYGPDSIGGAYRNL